MDRATLLLVEDDPLTRSFLADNLTADGYELLVCGTVRDALRALEYHRPDLAVVDLRLPDGSGLDLIRRVRDADGLIEGYRPGVMERLGLGPEELLKDNPKLIYGRATGWGQDGPLAGEAGHDINYLALTGLLSGLGPKSGRPLPPANFLADYAGGGLMLAFGMVAALLNVQRGGQGQVIDAAMTDGAAHAVVGVARQAHKKGGESSLAGRRKQLGRSCTQCHVW